MKKPQTYYPTDQVIDLLQTMTLPDCCCENCRKIQGLMIETAVQGLNERHRINNERGRVVAAVVGGLICAGLAICVTIVILTFLR